MPVMPCECCGRSCFRPSAFLIKASYMVLCCGVTSLASVNGVTFLYLPNGRNVWTNAVGLLLRNAYTVLFNCDPTTIHASGLYINFDWDPVRVAGYTFLQYQAIDTSSLDTGGEVQTGPDGNSAKQAGMIFDYEAGVNGMPAAATAPWGIVTVPSYHAFTQACTFPDPFVQNWVANAGSATITPICTLVTFTSGTAVTATAGPFVSGTGAVAAIMSAAGSGSITFTAVNATGGPGSWYAGKGINVLGTTYIINGTGTFADDLAFTSATTGSGTATVTFTITANSTGADRIFYVLINDREYEITQRH